MDLTALSTEELDALQLAVNVEISARLQKTRMTARLAQTMESASSAGVPDADIATSFAEAKSLAKIKYQEPVLSKRPALVSRTAPTPTRRRTKSGFRTNIIDENA